MTCDECRRPCVAVAVTPAGRYCWRCFGVPAIAAPVAAATGGNTFRSNARNAQAADARINARFDDE